MTALGQAGDPSSIDVLTRYTTDLSPQIRAAAFDALGSIGGDRAIAVLSEMVSHGTADDSSAAAMALADSREPGARAVLLDLAAGDDPIALRAATALIGADGEDVAALMRTRLASDEPEIAMIGVQHATVRRDREAIPRLAELAGHRLRGFMRSVDAIRTIGGDGAQSALERLASRPGPARPWAIDALVAIPATHQRAIELAMEIVRDEGGRDVSMALRVLARDPGESARDALFECVRSGGPIGAEALRLLGERRDVESERLLMQIAADTTSATRSLRVTALRGLAQSGGPGSEAEHAVIAAISDPGMNSFAIYDLAGMGTPTASRALLDFAASPEADEGLRAQAIQGACRQGACDVRTLTRLVDNANEVVAGAALDALCQRSPAEARMQIDALMRSTEPNRRTLAVAGAAGLRPDDARPILLAALSDPEASVAIEAIRHFDAIGGRATQDALVATMTNEGALEEVRAEAASYLREQGGPMSRTYSVLIDRLTGESENGDVMTDSVGYDSIDSTE